MTKIVAIANQKGGVGKTTTSVNLAAGLAASRQRVLLIDLDPQGNASGGSGIDKNALTFSAKEVLLDRATIAQARVNTDWGFAVVPANDDLTVAEVGLLSLADGKSRLKMALAAMQDDYHFILIDCPPSLNMLTVNALVAAGAVLIPIQCEYYALEGLASLLNNIEKIRQTVNPTLQLEGVLRTMYDGRNRLTLEVSEQLKQHFADKVYQTVIPRNVRVAEAPSHGTPVTHYDQTSQGALAYLALAGELLQRQQHAQQQARSLKGEIT